MDFNNYMNGFIMLEPNIYLLIKIENQDKFGLFGLCLDTIPQQITNYKYK